jgi:hypothetical protein
MGGVFGLPVAKIAWVAISYAGDGPQETPAQWVISVTSDPGVNLARRMFQKVYRYALEQLREQVRRVPASNDATTVIV